MRTQTYRSVVVQRRDTPAPPERPGVARIATMDHKDEEIELATLFHRYEERLRDLAAIEGLKRGKERP